MLIFLPSFSFLFSYYISLRTYPSYPKMAAVSSAKHNDKANTSEMKMDQSSVLEHPQDVLETCATGQWSALQTVLSAAGIVAPAPAITVHNKSKYALPQTHEMVEAAIRGKQCSIIELIYKVFPSARRE